LLFPQGDYVVRDKRLSVLLLRDLKNQATGVEKVCAFALLFAWIKWRVFAASNVLPIFESVRWGVPE
jgi:hypothetical protein